MCWMIEISEDANLGLILENNIECVNYEYMGQNSVI